MFQFVLHLLRDQEDAILSSQFEDLHLPAQFHASEFLAHASVEELVEEDKAIVALDAHFQDVLLQFVRFNVSMEAEGVLVVLGAAKLSEEWLELILSNFEAPISFLSEDLPNSVEFIEVVFESLD